MFYLASLPVLDDDISGLPLNHQPIIGIVIDTLEVTSLRYGRLLSLPHMLNTCLSRNDILRYLTNKVKRTLNCLGALVEDAV